MPCGNGAANGETLLAVDRVGVAPGEDAFHQTTGAGFSKTVADRAGGLGNRSPALLVELALPNVRQGLVDGACAGGGSDACVELALGLWGHLLVALQPLVHLDGTDSR